MFYQRISFLSWSSSSFPVLSLLRHGTDITNRILLLLQRSSETSFSLWLIFLGPFLEFCQNTSCQQKYNFTWSWTFTATKFDEVFSGHQLHQVSVGNQHLEDHLGPHQQQYQIPDGGDWGGPWNVGFVQIPDTADILRRLQHIITCFFNTGAKLDLSPWGRT
jgi:hypothetical protein